MDWGLFALRLAGALLDLSMHPCGTTSPSLIWTIPAPDRLRAPQPRARAPSGPGETVQTCAVNQRARTMTPKEAKILLSVQTHHNSRLFNLERHRVSSEGE